MMTLRKIRTYSWVLQEMLYCTPVYILFIEKEESEGSLSSLRIIYDDRERKKGLGRVVGGIDWSVYQTV